jgi:hypothetical protein
MYLRYMIYGVDYSTRTLSGNPDPSQAKPELLDCQGCNARVPELEWIGRGWDFYGCPDCVAQCAQVDRDETGCEPFELEPESEMPVLKPIQAKPVQPSIPEYRKPEVA